MLSSAHKILLICPIIMLCACSSDDEPTRPDSDSSTYKDFTIARAEILPAEAGYITDSYYVDLVSKQGDHLDFYLNNHCLGQPSGTFSSSNSQGSGSLYGISYSQSSTVRDSPDYLTLHITPEPSGTVISGELTTVRGTSINITGHLDFSFPKIQHTLTFPTLTSHVESPDGSRLSFDISDPDTGEGYNLYLHLPEIATGTFALAQYPAELTGHYLTAGKGLTHTRLVISDGHISTNLTGNVFSGHIEYENFDLRFTCELPQSDYPDPEFIPLTHILEVRESGNDFISIKMAQEGIEMLHEPITWQVSYKGSGQFVDLEIYAPEGKLKPGHYNISSTPSPNTFRAGWDPGDIYGIGIPFQNWGTCLYSLTDKSLTTQHITDGIVTIDLNDSDTPLYTITLISSLISARYTGPLAAP